VQDAFDSVRSGKPDSAGILRMSGHADHAYRPGRISRPNAPKWNEGSFLQAQGEKVRTSPCGGVPLVQDAFDHVRVGKPMPKAYRS
jgi:hypothetical protein